MKAHKTKKRVVQSTTLFYVHTELLVSQPISRVLSWTAIHLGQMSPPASSNLPVPNAGHAIWKPIWSCSEWGLPCHRCYQRRGALLPHPFTLTCVRMRTIGGLLSAALSVGFHLPGVTWHSTLWSPDFPLHNTLCICKQKTREINTATVWSTQAKCIISIAGTAHISQNR